MLLNILQTILQDIADYTVDESRCTKLISPKSSCDKCAKACPLSCIHITEDIHIDDTCVSCGICSQVCPTQAIKMKLQTLDYLVHVADSDEPFVLGCKKHAGTNPTYSKNFCIGSLPDEYILYVLLKRPSMIQHFDSSECEHCELFSGFKDFAERKSFLENCIADNRILSSVSDEGVTEKQKKTREEYDDDKRAFLKSFVSIRKALNDATDETSDSQMLFHKVYRRLLEEYPELYGTLYLHFPQKSGDCSRCEACTRLCPSHALTLTKSALILNPSKCCNCGLCSEVCYDKALTMKPLSFEDFSSAALTII